MRRATRRPDFSDHRMPVFDYDDWREHGEIRSARVNPLVRIIVQPMRDPLGAMAYRRSDLALDALARRCYRASARCPDDLRTRARGLEM